MTKKRTVWAGLVATAALLVAFVPGLRAADADGTPWLGVYTQNLTDDLREGLYYNGSGVIVNRVVRDSPADRGGIRKGDVITRVDNRDIASSDALADVILSRRIGDQVSVRVVRDRGTKELKVTLAPRDDGEDGDRPHRFRWYGDDGSDHDFNFDFDDGKIDLPQIERMVMIGGRGRLGVRIESLNDQLGDYFQVKKGALVLDVTDDSPAEKAGIHAGDVITKLGSKDIADPDDLVRAVSGAEGKVSVTLVRHGRTQTVEAELNDKPRVMTWGMDPDNPRRLVMRGHAREMREHARELRDEVRKQRQLSRDEESELRDALRELRQELREMKRELEEMKDND